MEMETVSKEAVSRILTLHQKIRYYKIKVYDKNFKVNSLSEKYISEKQFAILFLIGFVGVQTVTEISVLVSRTTGSLSTIMSKMVREELISKCYPEGKEDRRKVYYSLTPKGYEIFNCCLDECIDKINGFLRGLEEQRIAYFNKAYDLISSIFQEHIQDEIICGIQDFKLEHEDKETEFPLKIIKQLVILVLWTSKFYLDEFDFEKNEVTEKLTHSKFRVLAALCMEDYVSISRIAEIVQNSESAVSLTLSKLVEDDYLRRDHPSGGQDGRKVYYCATDRGRQAFETVKEEFLRIFERSFNALSDEHKKVSLEGMEYLSKVFD